MGRRSILALAFVVTLVSCVDTESGATTTEAPVATTSSSTSTTSPEPVDSGMLAVIDAAGDVVVMAPDGTSRAPVTDNGGSDNPWLYMQPVWSPDGTTLAWGQTTGTGFGVGISEPGSDLITTLTTPTPPFFTYWSPNSRYLGILHNGDSGVQFQIADTGRESTELLDEDAPFYFSWSPDSARVVTHAGANRVETISPDGDRVALEPTTGNYLAPQWTDNGVFHVVGEHLVVEDEDGARRPVAAVAGLALFVANHQGTLVAVQSTGGDGSGITASTEEFPTAPTGAVVVVDVDSGDSEVVTTDVGLGFFWSRGGESLLTLTVAEGGIATSVWTADAGSTQYATYRPPATMLRDTFPFFPQYAQSVSFWSPDSSAFAFAGEVDGVSGVWVQERDEAAPTRVTDGRWVVWSVASP